MNFPLMSRTSFVGVEQMTVSSAYQRNDEEDDRVDILFFTKQQITFAYTLSTFENATFFFCIFIG